jgi:NADPH2:quinone reductase
MKAIAVRAFGEPGVMGLETVADPVPGAGQVLVRVKAAGVNPVDTYVRSGAYGVKPDLPYTPGTDAAGVVEAVGEGVTSWARGDRVYLHGTPRGHGRYAELTVAEMAHVHRLPDHVSFQQGAALGVPYATAWAALFLHARARPGETVFIHGASGGVGVAAVQIARFHGMRVVASAGTDQGMALVKELGAHEVVNHTDPAYLQRVRASTGDRGVDVVLEMLANVNLDRDLDVIALHGRVVVIGSRGRVEIDPRKIMRKDAAILAMLLFNASPEDLAVIHAALVGGMEAGVLKPVVGRELPLADAPTAHAAVMEPGAHGKIVLIP